MRIITGRLLAVDVTQVSHQNNAVLYSWLQCPGNYAALDIAPNNIDRERTKKEQPI